MRWFRRRSRQDIYDPDMARVMRCRVCGGIVVLLEAVVWSPGFPPTPHDQHGPKVTSGVES